MRAIHRKNNIKLTRRIFIYLLGVTLLSVISLGFFWVQSKFNNYHHEVLILQKTYSETKKLEIRNKILQIKDYIRWIQTISTEPINNTLSAQVRQFNLPSLEPRLGYKIISNSLPQCIMDSLNQSRVPIYILNAKGEIVYCCNPFSTKKSIKFSSEETDLFHKINKRIGTSEGIQSGYQHTGVHDSILSVAGYFNCDKIPGFKIVSMVKRVNFDKVLQIHILDSISKLRYAENEYVFINTIEGKALITNGKYNKKPINIFTTGNVQWINIFKIQQSVANKPAGVFHTYQWQKLLTTKSSLKTSYFSYIPEWQWIIGTGYYEDDINAIIEERKMELNADMQKTILHVFYYLVISTLLCFILVWFFSKRLGKNIDLFKVFFERAAKENLWIDKSQVNYKEFLAMADAANFMVEERKLGERALMESEAHYRFLFEQNPVPLLIYELATLRLLNVNNSFIKHYGYSIDEIKSMKLPDLYAENEKIAITDLSNRLKGHMYMGEWHQIKKNGQQIIVDVHSNELNYEGMASRIAVVNDITERKKGEAKIINLNRVYVVLSNVNHAIVHIREKQELFERICQIAIEDGRFLMAWIGIVSNIANNVGVAAFSGKNDGYLDNLTIDLSDEALSRGPTGMAIKSGMHYICNSIATDKTMVPWRKNALKRGFKSSVAVPFKISNNLQGAITLYSDEENYFNQDEIELLDKLAMDIAYALEFIEIESKRKQVEVETKQLTQQLLKAEEIAHFGFLDWNLITNEIYLSPEINKIYGIPVDVINVAEFITKVVHPDDIAFVNENLDLAIQGIKEYNIDHRIVHPNGKVIWLNARGELFKDENGKPNRLLGTILDITNRKVAEAEILKLNQELENRVIQRTEQLESMNKELEAFSYSVSHDLRAPLRHVSGYLDLLTKRNYQQLDDKGKHYIQSISEASNQMGILIDDLLNFSRTGRMEMKLDLIDMNLAMKAAVTILEPDTKGRIIEWKFALLPTVYADFAMIRQVWVNLLSNAIKYTRKREVAKIEIGSKKENNEHVFFVMDNGAGFDLQYAQKLFGVFQRLHTSADFEGTGIGLANVRQVIKRHHGRTWATGEIDKGAIFYFSLPIR